jgi:hypothetical protein
MSFLEPQKTGKESNDADPQMSLFVSCTTKIGKESNDADPQISLFVSSTTEN